MNDSGGAKTATQISGATFPRCMRCDKPVEKLKVTPHPHQANVVIVEYQCHGESVEQEIPASMLEGEHGLAAYTAFNDFTSGLLPQK